MRREVTPVLNSDKDMSAAHAFDATRPVPRGALTPEADAVIPWGEHPDDDRFITVDADTRVGEDPR